MAQLEKGRGELLGDNRRMAEMLATSEGESQEVADMLERLSQEKRQLQRQYLQLKENGNCRFGLGLADLGFSLVSRVIFSLHEKEPGYKAWLAMKIVYLSCFSASCIIANPRRPENEAKLR